MNVDYCKQLFYTAPIYRDIYILVDRRQNDKTRTGRFYPYTRVTVVKETNPQNRMLTRNWLAENPSLSHLKVLSVNSLIIHFYQFSLLESLIVKRVRATLYSVLPSCSYFLFEMYYLWEEKVLQRISFFCRTLFLRQIYSPNKDVNIGRLHLILGYKLTIITGLFYVSTSRINGNLNLQA